jgi:GntR family transcriptional regulator
VSDIQLDKNSESLPKYIQIAKIIRDRIEKKEYQGEQQIPSEAELCATFQVSRITAREAINKLVAEGYLERRQGKGTYVAHQKIRRSIDRIYSFSNDMRHMGLNPSSKMLALLIEEADSLDAKALKLPPKDRRVTRISRVRLANDIPVLVETTLIPEYLCPDLVNKDLRSGSLYQILTEDYKLVLDHAEETYETVIMEKEDAKLFELDLKKPRAAFYIRNITFLNSGQPIELTTATGRGDLLTLSINMFANEANVTRVVGV